MITEINADLFELKVDALAHGCNTLGKMDAGIAREFRLRYPAMYREYLAYCRSGSFKPGDVHFYRSNDQKPHVINIATQLDLSGARLEYIREGLKNIEKYLPKWRISSLGMPRIGSGLGHLDWKDVKQIVEEVFGTSDLELLIANKS